MHDDVVEVEQMERQDVELRHVALATIAAFASLVLGALFFGVFVINFSWFRLRAHSASRGFARRTHACSVKIRKDARSVYGLAGTDR